MPNFLVPMVSRQLYCIPVQQLRPFDIHEFCLLTFWHLVSPMQCGRLPLICVPLGVLLSVIAPVTAASVFFGLVYSLVTLRRRKACDDWIMDWAKIPLNTTHSEWPSLNPSARMLHPWLVPIIRMLLDESPLIVHCSLDLLRKSPASANLSSNKVHNYKYQRSN